LATFVLTQVSEGNVKQLRRTAADPVGYFPRSKQLLTTLLGLAKNDAYKSFDFAIQNLWTFITNPEKTLADLDDLLTLVTSSTYKPPINLLFYKIV